MVVHTDRYRCTIDNCYFIRSMGIQVKKLFVLLLMSTTAFAAESWTLLGTTPDSEMWIDENSNSHYGSFAQITEKVKLKSNVSGYDEQIITWKFNCSESTVMQARTIFLLNRKVVKITLSTDWVEHNPNDISKVLAYIACSSIST